MHRDAQVRQRSVTWRRLIGIASSFVNHNIVIGALVSGALVSGIALGVRVSVIRHRGERRRLRGCGGRHSGSDFQHSATMAAQRWQRLTAGGLDSGLGEAQAWSATASQRGASADTI